MTKKYGILIGGAACLLVAVLTGCVSLLWSRKRSSPPLRPSSESSTATQEALRVFESRMKALELEWEATYDRMRSLAGRMDRSKRRKGEDENGAEELIPDVGDLTQPI